MKALSLVLLAALSATAPALADAPKDKPADKEFAAADAERWLVFFNRFVDLIVQNKDSCPKMAAAANAHIDANIEIVRKVSEERAAGKRAPKAIADKMTARVREMMPAMQKCGGDKDVLAAVKRMDDKAVEKPPAKK